MKDEGDVKLEQEIHGRRWAAMHGGYFSDPAKAAALIKNLRAAVLAQKPAVVADLGGGTGFILSLLAKNLKNSAPQLVNVDMSRRQTCECPSPGIKCINTGFEELRRKDLLGDRTGPLLLTMRSVLHYAPGKNSCGSLLRHIRKLCQPGEYFVHQSACFETRQDAALMDRIFRLLGTHKHYTTERGLQAMLEDCGWEVLKSVRAPQLIFTADDERLRYGIDDRKVAEICRAVGNSGSSSAKARASRDFTGFFKYRIFVCRAR
ncbi:MAG: class I SAM-dependent methyltransferase [Elusimicrobia bacterium]|nr:class I SAM-dependent methyltransferase [Elusimicrobiota bacterium]